MKGVALFVAKPAGGDTLADAFLAAPFEPGGWDVALKKLATETRSARSQLIAFGGPNEFPFNLVTDPDPGFIEEFPEIDGGSPKVNWRVACAGRPLELAWEDHYDVASRRLKSEVYDEFVDRFRMPFGCQTVLLDTGKVFYGLAALRTRQDGRTNEEARSVFEAAAHHVLAAVKLQQALEYQGASLIAGAFEAFGGAIFVCDGQGRVQALTRAAEAALRVPGALRIVRNRLTACRPEDDRALQDALHRAIRSDGGAPAGEQFWLRSGPSAWQAVRCEVLPLPRRDWSMGFEPRAIVRLHSPGALEDTRSAELRSLLGLTPAEAEIALLAARGMSREEIAQARGATVNTVSSQLKSIFMKADVTREGQLVALLNRLLR